MISSLPFPSTLPTCAGKPSAVVRMFDDRPFRADGEVLALSFAPDGTLWSVEEPGILRRWDLRERRQVEWHSLSDLENLWVFSRDGRVVAAASDEVSLWDVASGQLETLLPQPSWVTALALSGDATLVATGHEDGVVCLWDSANDEPMHELSAHDSPISAVAFSHNGARLATAGEDRVIRLWDVASGQPQATLEGPHDRIPALLWHPEGHRLYSSGWDTSVWVWDVTSGQPVILLNNHDKQIQAIALSRDGRFLACADSGRSIHIWDLTTHRPTQVFRSFDTETRTLAFSPSGQIVASGGSDRVVSLWGAPSPSSEELRVPSDLARAGLALSPSGERLASLVAGKGVRVWETSAEKKVFDLDAESELLSVAYSPEGRFLAAGGVDHRIRLWDAQTGDRRTTLEGPPHPVTAIAFAPRAAVLASASSASCDVWLWNTERAEPILVIPDAAEGCSVEALAFQPQGELLAVAGIDWLATGGGDGHLVVWDVIQPQRLFKLPGGARAVAFHPAGRLLLAASLVRTVRIWDVTTGELEGELIGHEDAVTCVACSPDGRLVATGSDDRTVRLWDVTTGTLLGTTELDTQVKHVVFAPDGRYLYTGNGNSSCYQLRTHRLAKG